MRAEESDDYLHYAMPPNAKRLGPGTTRDPAKTTFNYFAPGAEVSWSNIIARETYDDGKLIERALYKDGVKHGVQRTWHHDGLKATESPYLNGVMHGKFCEWNEHGQLIGNYPILNGMGTKRIYDGHGKLVHEEEIEKSLGNGTRMNVSNIEATLSLVWQKDGTVIGKAFEFYPTDQLSSFTCYSVDGIPNGPCVAFTKGGAVTTKQWFVASKEVTESEYAMAASSDPNLPPYYPDATKYKEFIDAEVKALLEKYRNLPRVKIPLEFDQFGNPIPARS